MTAHIRWLAATITVLTLAATGGTHRIRAGTRRGQDDGISTLEIVVIGLGLFLIAGAAVAVFTGAIQTRLAKIR